MSTATVFRDRPLATSEKDENTVITDYWLNFMSVRRRDETQSVFPKRDLELKVDDFCRRLDTLSVERRTLADKIASLKPAPQVRVAGPENLRGAVERGYDSLLGRVRTGLYLGIQKLL